MTYQGHIAVSHRYSETTRDHMAARAEAEASRALPGKWRKADAKTKNGEYFVVKNLFAFPLDVTPDREVEFAAMMKKRLGVRPPPQHIGQDAACRAMSSYGGSVDMADVLKFRKAIHAYLVDRGFGVARGISDFLGEKRTRVQSALSAMQKEGFVERIGRAGQNNAIIVWAAIGPTDAVTGPEIGRKSVGDFDERRDAAIKALAGKQLTSKQFADDLGIHIDAARSRLKKLEKIGIVTRAENSKSNAVIWMLCSNV